MTTIHPGSLTDLAATDFPLWQPSNKPVLAMLYQGTRDQPPLVRQLYKLRGQPGIPTDTRVITAPNGCVVIVHLITDRVCPGTMVIYDGTGLYLADPNHFHYGVAR